MRCRVCKCTMTQPCNPPCAWAYEGLCTTCDTAVRALIDWKEEALHPSVSALVRELRYSLQTSIGRA